MLFFLTAIAFAKPCASIEPSSHVPTLTKKLSAHKTEKIPPIAGAFNPALPHRFVYDNHGREIFAIEGDSALLAYDIMSHKTHSVDMSELGDMKVVNIDSNNQSTGFTLRYKGSEQEVNVRFTKFSKDQTEDEKPPEEMSFNELVNFHFPEMAKELMQVTSDPEAPEDQIFLHGQRVYQDLDYLPDHRPGQQVGAVLRLFPYTIIPEEGKTIVSFSDPEIMNFEELPDNKVIAVRDHDIEGSTLLTASDISPDFTWNLMNEDGLYSVKLKLPQRRVVAVDGPTPNVSVAGALIPLQSHNGTHEFAFFHVPRFYLAGDLKESDQIEAQLFSFDGPIDKWHLTNYGTLVIESRRRLHLYQLLK